jgi:hypothetical protein
VKATKDELRAEIAELRRVGSVMSNLLYNQDQQEERLFPEGRLREVVRMWDAIERRERL